MSEKCNGLETLNIQSCTKITDNGIKYISDGCPQLTSINISNCRELTDISLLHLANGCSSLISIDISGTKITDNGLKLLVSQSSKLQNISLGKNNNNKFLDFH